MESFIGLRRKRRRMKKMSVRATLLARRGWATQQSLCPVMNAHMDRLGGSAVSSILLFSLNL